MGTYDIRWVIINVLGTIAFSISGALVAIDEDFDLLGAYILGFITAFGGGITRNLVIGIPVEYTWDQNELFLVAFVTISIVYFIPRDFWGERSINMGFVYSDALALAAFALQGAHLAMREQATFVGVIIAGMLTGTGGGVIRDVLANRKPLIFQDEIYAVWTLLGTIPTYFAYPLTNFQMAIIMMVIVFLRVTSLKYKWRLPRYSSKYKNRRLIK